MNKILSITFLISTLIISACTMPANVEYNSDTTPLPETEDDTTSENDESSMQDDNTAMEEVENIPIPSEGDNAIIKEFSKSEYDTAISDKKYILLAFYADWCPNCKYEIAELEKAAPEITRDDLVIFKLNYKDGDTDKEEENLAKENNIVYQHTKVLINPEGEKVFKELEVWDKETIIEKLTEI